MKQTPNSAPNRSTLPPATFIFEGFDGWVELFKTGTHTDGKGDVRTWSTNDLDQMVFNNDKIGNAPIVVGHPSNNAPAFGWTTELKRDGDILLGKFSQLNKDFVNAVESGSYKKRSIAVNTAPDGTLYVRHVGFLGGAAPAIKGLEDVQFSDADSTTEYVFSLDAETPSMLGRFLRRFREWVISSDGIEAADQVAPEYMVEQAGHIAERIRQDRDMAKEGHLYSSAELQTPKSTEENIMTKEVTFSQADIDAAKEAGRKDAEAKHSEQPNPLQEQLDTANYTNRVASFTAKVSGWVDAGKLSAGMAAGMPEFMASFPDEAKEFSFSRAEGDKKVETKTDGLAFFEAMIDNMPPALAGLFAEQAGASSDVSEATTDDPTELAAKASQFVASEAKEGRVVTLIQAVTKFSKTNSV